MDVFMVIIMGVMGSNINYHDFTSATVSHFQDNAFITHDQLHPDTYLSTIYKLVTNPLVDVTYPNLRT